MMDTVLLCREIIYILDMEHFVEYWIFGGAVISGIIAWIFVMRDDKRN